jgi:3-oxoacyl-(acyl-carrier-protein) synthase
LLFIHGFHFSNLHDETQYNSEIWKIIQIAVAAGLEALKNAGLVRGSSSGKPEEDDNCWQLNAEHQDTTGVIFVTSFPAMEAVVDEVSRFHNTKQLVKREELKQEELENSSDLAENAFDAQDYEFDRKFLFKVSIFGSSFALLKLAFELNLTINLQVLVLANSQLAQIVKAKGPNMQSNAACAGTTHAISLAHDLLRSVVLIINDCTCLFCFFFSFFVVVVFYLFIHFYYYLRLGRADRIVVIAGDNASGDSLMPWIGSGFRALGAASICADATEAAVPFDARRNGMVVGCGGVGIVLERDDAFACRASAWRALRCSIMPELRVRNPCRVIDTHIANSAYHGASMDTKHMTACLETFLQRIEREHAIGRGIIAEHGMYLSHETMTRANPTSTCAGNEIAALRACFGDAALSKMLIVNTKGLTGHPMGVSFEDITAVNALMTGYVPPIVNHKVTDISLGQINLSHGGKVNCKFALRFAAGFGSQLAFVLYGTE